MTKIASMTPPIPRGTVSASGRRAAESMKLSIFSNVKRVRLIDMLDLGRDPRSRRALAASGCDQAQ